MGAFCHERSSRNGCVHRWIPRAPTLTVSAGGRGGPGAATPAPPTARRQPDDGGEMPTSRRREAALDSMKGNGRPSASSARAWKQARRFDRVSGDGRRSSVLAEHHVQASRLSWIRGTARQHALLASASPQRSNRELGFQALALLALALHFAFIESRPLPRRRGWHPRRVCLTVAGAVGVPGSCCSWSSSSSWPDCQRRCAGIQACTSAMRCSVHAEARIARGPGGGVVSRCSRTVSIETSSVRFAACSRIESGSGGTLPPGGSFGPTFGTGADWLTRSALVRSPGVRTRRWCIPEREFTHPHMSAPARIAAARPWCRCGPARAGEACRTMRRSENSGASARPEGTAGSHNAVTLEPEVEGIKPSGGCHRNTPPPRPPQ